MQEKITKLEENARNLREIIVNISGDVFEEEDEGARFRVKNMPEIKEDSRLIGTFQRNNCKFVFSMSFKFL